MKTFESFIDKFIKINPFDAIDDENYNKLKRYIDNGGDIEVESEWSRMTPIQKCAYSGVGKKFIILLIENGADLSKKNQYGRDFFDLLENFFTVYTVDGESITIPLAWWYMLNFPKESEFKLKEIDWLIKYGDYILFELIKKSDNNDEFKKIFSEKYKDYLKKQNIKKFKI